MNTQALWRNLKELAVDLGPRCPGTEGERRAAAYLRREFEQLGLETHLEEFPCPGWECEGASLALADGSARFEVTASMYSPGGEATGKLRAVRPAELDDLDQDELRGCIVFVPESWGGVVSRGQWALKLEALRARGLVVTSSHTHFPSTKYIRQQRLTRMPVAVLPVLAAGRLAAHVGEEVKLAVRAKRFEGTSANVVAELPGRGPGLACLTAHYDSAPFIQGAGDNASGVAVLLAVARGLATAEPSATVRFVAMGAEEFGGDDGMPLGSKVYAAAHEQEMPDVLWVLNVDHVGAALADHVVYVMQSRELETRVAQVLADLASVTSINRMQAGSDHYPFALHGVPAMFLTNDCHPFPVHTPADTIDTLLPAKLESAARAADAICRDLLANPLASRQAEPPAGRIRAAGEADLEPIEVMVANIWTMGRAAAMEQQHGLIGGKPWQEWVVPGIIANLKSKLAEGRLLVTELDGEVVGFISYGIDRDKSIGTIGYNGVRRDSGGRGVGSRQLQHVLDIFRSEKLRLAAVQTGLNEGHLPARRLYEKAGFRALMESLYYTMDL